MDRPWESVNMTADQWADIDAGYRKALLFYLDNREQMDAGVEMLDPAALPVHKFYWKQAGLGAAAVASELQQQPLQDEGTEEKQLHGEYILKRRASTPAFQVPSWGRWITVQVDVQKHCLWVEVDAWSADWSNCQLIEFGKTDTGMNKDGIFDALNSVAAKRQRVDQVIFDTLMKVHARITRGWPRENTGELVFPTIAVVDCGGTTPLEKDEAHAWYDTVLSFCQPKNTNGLWLPLKGEKWTRSIQERALEQGGVHWILEEKSQAHGRRDCHADYYKTEHYNALQIALPSPLAGEGRASGSETGVRGIPPGAKVLHADEGYREGENGERIYSSAKLYADHCSTEKYVAEFKDGANVDRADRVGWQLISTGRRNNHGWDTGWMGYAARDIQKHRQRQSAQKPRRPQSVSMGGGKLGGESW